MRNNCIKLCNGIACLLALLGQFSVAKAQPQVQLTPSKVSAIAPGTVIGEQAPDGWNYLLFKNSSSIGAGDLEYASDSIKNLASFLSSAMVANVESSATPGTPANYAIKDVGYGLVARIGKLDKVVSYETYEDLGANFGILEGMALSAAEKRLNRLQVCAKTATMYLVDSPTLVHRNGTHQDAIVRHAILVEMRTGSIVTLVWFIEPGKNKQPGQVISDIDFLPPNSDLKVVLHIDRKQFSLGVITERALALNRMTWGETQIKVPSGLGPLAVLPKFNREQLADLETQLRTLIRPSSNP